METSLLGIKFRIAVLWPISFSHKADTKVPPALAELVHTCYQLIWAGVQSSKAGSCFQPLP